MEIKWRRPVPGGGLNPSAGTAEEEILTAVSLLESSLSPLGIEVSFIKEELSAGQFENDPSESNRIWINGRSLEEYFLAETKKSPCCGGCGSSGCGPAEAAGPARETLLADLIVQAGTEAASELAGSKKEGGCCCS